ncbi:hypothetical protein [Parabacteroides sp. ZJ-118]|uniref:hypothetical protein n=1 Tax=Parabacteroides sp. ZJ-118 TaxID=2709398 RepID=UPI0013EAA395|nr:hypothetical protein [Parabacteroides sp. ZJ-118]
MKSAKVQLFPTTVSCFREPERLDAPLYLAQTGIKAKTRAFLRITPTRFRVLTLEQDAEKAGFSLTESPEKTPFRDHGDHVGTGKSQFLAPWAGEGEQRP